MKTHAAIKVPLPKELEAFRLDLEYFFETMVRKLYSNRHKGVPTDLDPYVMLGKMQDELAEVRLSIAYSGQFDVAIECADVANFAFLLARGVYHMDRQQFDVVKTSGQQHADDNTKGVPLNDTF